MCKTKNNNLMNKKQIFLIIIAASLSFMTAAQTKSPYSRYGLGVFKAKGSTRVNTMGGAGIALQQKTDVNGLNPSALVAMDSTAVLFDLGFHVNGSRFSDNNISEYVYSGNLDYVTLAIPMKKYWFLSASIKPLTSVGYNINTTQDYVELLNQEYTINYMGKGGTSLATLTNSFKLPGGLSLGVEYGYMWGNHDETITELYSGMDVASTTRQETIFTNGTWLTTGLQFKHDFEKTSFTFGATYDVKTAVKSYSETTISSSISNIKNETSGTSSDYIPEGYGIGFSINYDKRLTLAADYRTKKWSESGIGIASHRLCDNHIFSFGTEFTPDFNSNKYLDRVSYRGGIHYESGSIIDNGQSVNSAYISIGLGLPGRMPNTIVNVGLKLGTIGGFNSSHISETYGQLNVGLNLGEIWFMKPMFY